MPDIDVVREPGAGKLIWMLGGLYEIKVAGAETGGQLTVVEMTIPAGGGPPPHTHDGDETLYVLSGKLRYHMGDKTIDAGPGYVFHVKRGTWEYFEPMDTCHVVVHYMPGGIDKFFLEAGEPATGYELPPPTHTPTDFDRLSEIGARYGMRMRRPPGVR